MTDELTAADRIFNTTDPKPDPKSGNGMLLGATPTKVQVKASGGLTAADRIFSGPPQKKDIFASNDEPAERLTVEKPAVKKPAVEKSAAEKEDRSAEPHVEDGADKGELIAPEQLIEELALDVDDPMATDFATAASELGLDKDGAQRLVDLELQNRTAYWDKQADVWMADLRRSGDVERMGASARAVVSRFGDANFAKDIGVYGNHPGLIKMLDRIGQELGL